MNTHRFLFLIILLVACIPSAGTDIYAPSLSSITQIMQITTGQAQFSLTIFMVGLAFSQLFYGPISEGIGRRYTLMIGLLIFISGTLLCLFATNINHLIGGRLIQGMGAGACSSLWRAVFRDVYEGEELAKKTSWLTLIFMFAIPAAPILGGYFQHYFGWRMSFAFLFVYGVLTLLFIMFVFKETSQHHHPDRLKLTFIVQTFKQLLMSRIFMGYSLAVFFCYGAFFSWITISPVLLIHYLGLNAVQFGWLSFIISAGGMALSGMINRALVKTYGITFMLRLGWGIIFMSGCLLLAGNALFGVNLYCIVLCVFLFYLGVTFTWPNAFAGAFAPFGSVGGYAGSLYSFLQLGGGAIIGSCSSYLPADSPVPLALIFIGGSIAAWLSYAILVNE